MTFVTYCFRKSIKDDLERNRRSSLNCVKRPPVSTPNITPMSGRLSLSSAAVSTLNSTNSYTVKSQSSLPVCGDSFFEDSDADRSHSNWSLSHAGTEFSSFNVSNLELHDTPSSRNVVRSREMSPAGRSMCSVQRSPMSTLQCQTTSVTAQSVSRDTTDAWLTSRQPNTTVSGLPTATKVSQQKLPSTSSAAASTTACSPPSGLIDFVVWWIIHKFDCSSEWEFHIYLCLL